MCSIAALEEDGVPSSPSSQGRAAVIEFGFDDYDSIEKDGIISTRELVSKLLTQWER